ncbi:glutathione peroxidase 7 [Lingula anatina]|uniref:Glutathione peroxidase n=1 Tax=Lingula anatina TaxID=7574 RepID=A0A1S3JH18_LINAN|nr:glutathione peroxidase 7 [Lingula anatina]|eukprot:XP_013409653.1 glutathione peroxidase 7 [Lingula anatina]
METSMSPKICPKNILNVVLFSFFFVNIFNEILCGPATIDPLKVKKKPGYRPSTGGLQPGEIVYEDVTPTTDEPEKDFYMFSVTDIKGKTVSLEEYRGMVTLVVNVASECGYTDSHYKALVKLQNTLAPSGKFTVLAFPCNQFGAQEPKDEPSIEKFAKEKYGVNFPMFSKINVVEKDIPEAWKFLEDFSRLVPNWNFWKYLINPSGHVIATWGPWIPVEDVIEQITEAVHAAADDLVVSDTIHEEL